MATRVAGRVVVAVGSGPPIVLTMEGQITIEDHLPMYAGRRYLGITSQQLRGNGRSLLRRARLREGATCHDDLG